jgi:hypothetical protein
MKQRFYFVLFQEDGPANIVDVVEGSEDTDNISDPKQAGAFEVEDDGEASCAKVARS